MNVIGERTSLEIRIPAGRASLSGTLVVPESAKGIVLFAHGSGSSRHSPRNAFVAQALQRADMATLLFDLLTGAEEKQDRETREHRFDVGLLAGRLVEATHWVYSRPDLGRLPVGYFGASTGSAAALVAAAALGSQIAAVVSRGGRPDLAGEAVLARVAAATLLIVGSRDGGVIELNRRAYAPLPMPKRLAIMRGASHLFEEPGALEEVASLAAHWFRTYLATSTAEPDRAGR